ncbi:MAG: signal recognition particle-docking protein FtsY [Chitinispirillales bacterium]|jgi:fused signal recognition particle receptor|nr:signal recognition particle-docking protein FtsY [Chitinispirillales bacterium]
MGVLSRLFEGMSKTRNKIAQTAGDLGKEISDDFYELLEDALICADVGADVSADLVKKLREEVAIMDYKYTKDAYELFKKIVARELLIVKPPEEFPPKPWTILVVGVNGVGKTTTIGKLAKEFRSDSKSVMLAAADTFRAGAIEQLKIWSQKSDCDFISQHDGSDAASVVFDAMGAAKKRGTDVLIIDTAGRLHNKTNLMNELEKIVRVLKKANPCTPNEVLLVVDATTGQNAVNQAKVFNETVHLTGFVITKLDGTAKGGIAISLTKRFGIPIQKIGVGEGIDDLQKFVPEDYAEAMLGELE